MKIRNIMLCVSLMVVTSFLLSGCATNAAKPSISGSEAMKLKELSDSAVLEAVAYDSMHKASISGLTEFEETTTEPMSLVTNLNAYDPSTGQCISGRIGAQTATIWDGKFPECDGNAVGNIFVLLSTYPADLTISRDGDSFDFTWSGAPDFSRHIEVTDGLVTSVTNRWTGTELRMKVVYELTPEALRLLTVAKPMEVHSGGAVLVE